ncbi:TolB family protein [candidate division KSB1 bacterium]
MRGAIALAFLATLFASCGDEDNGNIVFFGKSMTQLTTTGGESPSWSPDGQSIVYVSNTDLWLISPDGGSPSRLTTMAGGETNPVWHPDASNREIVFINYSEETFTINRLDVASGEPEAVFSSATNIMYPSFTNDGSQIAFVVGLKGRGIHLVPVAGSEESTQITNDDGWDNVAAARLSPTQAQVAYVENRAGTTNIFSLDLAGGKPNQLTNYAVTAGDANKIFYVDWAKDGQKLLFAHSANPYFFTSALYYLDLQTGTPEPLTEDPLVGAVDFRNPSYSPDGAKIVCQRTGELWILEL